MTNYPVIVSFDGNIGSGKSTIVKYLKNNYYNYCKKNSKDLNICFLQEPVTFWESIKDDDGKNIIEHFYEDNERYSFAFQMMAYISRLKLIKDALAGNLVVS